MGCYFLTLSLMSGINAPIGIMGIILPIYTIIDMIEGAMEHHQVIEQPDVDQILAAEQETYEYIESRW